MKPHDDTGVFISIAQNSAWYIVSAQEIFVLLTYAWKMKACMDEFLNHN